jgi:hypothetical protein
MAPLCTYSGGIPDDEGARAGVWGAPYPSGRVRENFSISAGLGASSMF